MEPALASSYALLASAGATYLCCGASGRRPGRAGCEGRGNAISAGAIDVCEVDLGRTNCNDGFAEFTKDGKRGYGIVELGTQAPAG